MKPLSDNNMYYVSYEANIYLDRRHCEPRHIEDDCILHNLV